jgi:prepilin-type N-terminal cleavage/methylation domain-containing protein
MRFLVLGHLRMNHKQTSKKAFSMIEMLVTMAIFGMFSVMLLNSLLLNIKLSTKINLRSRVRSEMEEVATFIQRDIRNASEVFVGSCNPSCGSSLTLRINGVDCTWRLVAGNSYIERICPTRPSMNLRTSTLLYLTRLNFSRTSAATDELATYKYVNVLVTIRGEADVLIAGCEKDMNVPPNGCQNGESGVDLLWVDDQIRYFSVSTRNYLID